MPPKVGSSAAMMSTSLSGSCSCELDVEHVDAGELLEQHALAFHHRLGGQRADVAQAQHRGAVGDDADQIAARGQRGGLARDRRRWRRRRRRRRRIGERQVALVGQRLGRGDGDLARGRAGGGIRAPPARSVRPWLSSVGFPLSMGGSPILRAARGTRVIVRSERFQARMRSALTISASRSGGRSRSTG